MTDLVQLAEANGQTPGNWKHVSEHPDGRVCLRQDAWGQTQNSVGPAGQTRAPVIPATAEWLSKTKARFESLGYPCHARDDRLIISLASWQAEVAPEADGCIACSVFAGAAASATVQAMALFLLRAGGCVRIVRGFLSAPPPSKAGFMARLGQECSDEEVAEVLEALTVCCHLFAKSVSALENENAARRYLAISAPPTRNQLEGELPTC